LIESLAVLTDPLQRRVAQISASSGCPPRSHSSLAPDDFVEPIDSPFQFTFFNPPDLLAESLR